MSTMFSYVVVILGKMIICRMNSYVCYDWYFVEKFVLSLQFQVWLKM